MSKKGYFRHVERLLYDYKTYDNAIRVLQAEHDAIMEELLPPQGSSVVKLGGGDSSRERSQTERWGIRRAQRARRLERKLLELKRYREAVRGAREGLNHDEAQFVRLKYDLERSHGEARRSLEAAGCYMSERTYYRFRETVIEKIAKHLGL